MNEQQQQQASKQASKQAHAVDLTGVKLISINRPINHSQKHS
jgi:hypothetical protein